ncbi:MAG: hypothetical protein RIR69_208 [Actinomycetota bacterium]
MTRIVLFIPALNEQQGIELTSIAAQQAVDKGLIAQAYVLDGGSVDRTKDIAESHGLSVVDVATCLSDLGPVLGKGDSLFRGVHTIDADWFVFLDADLGNISCDHIAALVNPIGRNGVRFVKGGFVRIDENGKPRDVPGGRVTEEYGRPLLRKIAPELADFSQPLSGQVTIDAQLARSLTFVTGYGIEIAMLIDVWRSVGMDAIVEADMGSVNNRWKPDADLSHVIADVVSAVRLRGIDDTWPDIEMSVVERRR